MEQHAGQLMRTKRLHGALTAVSTPEADDSDAIEDAKHCSKCLSSASSKSLLGWVDPRGDGSYKKRFSTTAPVSQITPALVGVQNTPAC
jgi:hypothetical protein